MAYPSMFRLSWETQRDKLDGLTRQIKLQANKNTLETTRELKANIQAEAPEDTRALKASVYMVAGRVNDYDRSVAEAARLRPEVDWLAREEVESGDLDKRTPSGLVAVAAPYGGFINAGTSRNAPDPFFDRGVQKTVPRFEVRQRTLIEDAYDAL